MNLLNDLIGLADQHRELLDLAEVTVGLLEQGDLEALDDAWERRQRLFERMTMARRRLEPALADWDRTLAGLDQGPAAQAQKLVDVMAQKGAAVLELDQKAQVLMRQAMDRLDQELNRIEAGRKLIRGYSSPTRGPSEPHSFSKMG